MDLKLLQDAWFILLGVLLTGYAILDGFDLGVGILHLFVRGERERRVTMNSIGPVWDGNEVWLLTGGGAMFAAFPPVYATVFSGFYLAFMLLLLALIARAVSLEFRGKVEAPAWKSMWDLGFGVGSFVAALLFGVALGNILQGLPLDSEGNCLSTFLDLLSPYALLVGFTGLSLFVLHGAIWLMMKGGDELAGRMRRTALAAWALFLLFFLAATGMTAAAAPERLSAGLASAVVWAALALLVGCQAALPLLVRAGRAAGAFVASSVSIGAVMAIVGASLHPALVPSTLSPQSNTLTIYNASSSANTLTVMLIIALSGMPLVLAYTLFIYRAFKGRVALDEDSY
jgi:cytochrome d ubiquinol oxidase subunit II